MAAVNPNDPMSAGTNLPKSLQTSAGFAVLSGGSMPSARSRLMPPSNRLVDHVRRYFDRHPEVSREEFLLEAVRREIHAREQRETDRRARPMLRAHRGANRWSTTRSPLTAEDIRIHAWLNERLAVLHHERHGLWPRLRRVFFGSRLVRWLGLGAAARSGRKE